jgi:hypothetical protein
MHGKYWSENLYERDHAEDLGCSREDNIRMDVREVKRVGRCGLDASGSG